MSSTDKQKLMRSLVETVPGASAKAGQQRILEVVERGYSLSTYEAQRDLDVYDPPARVFQLRQAGYPIETHWTIVETAAGKKHRVGLYVLRGQKGGV